MTRAAILIGVCGHLFLSSFTANGLVHKMNWIECCLCKSGGKCYVDCVTPGHTQKKDVHHHT